MGAIDTVLAEVAEEVRFQQDRWGTQIDDTKNTPWMWAAYISQYATRWMAGTFLPLERNITDNFRAAMIKVAAIAISAVRSIDRQRGDAGTTFYEVQ